MDFDPRWSDNPRERDDYGRELSQGSRGGQSIRVSVNRSTASDSLARRGGRT